MSVADRWQRPAEAPGGANTGMTEERTYSEGKKKRATKVTDGLILSGAVSQANGSRN